MTELKLWYLIEGDSHPFSLYVSIPPNGSIATLKKQIYHCHAALVRIRGWGPEDLTLTKVGADLRLDVELNNIKEVEYRPSPNDEVLDEASRQICNVWPEPPLDDRVHISVRIPRGINPNNLPTTGMQYKAAEHLHAAMWRNDLEERLLDVDNCEGLKYLPSTEVRDLQLEALGLNENAILVREDYLFTLEELENRRLKFGIGGEVLTGHPGIGKSIFIFYLLLRLLSKGEPVALQIGDFFYLFSEDGVELFSARNEWIFQFEGKLWALVDSTARNKTPCPAFQSFSQRHRAFIVQATSISEVNSTWRKYCPVVLFIMKCFTEKEAKALGIISNLDVMSFLAAFKKWGPNARTCIRLAHCSLSEGELQREVTSAAKKFAQDPVTFAIKASSREYHHMLFTIGPISDNDRSFYTEKATTPYLCSLVLEEVAELDTTAQASFYRWASTLRDHGILLEGAFIRS